jgi:glycosyltransferase involved in cell wall biosynthesis
MKTLVVVPARNERSNLAGVVRGIREHLPRGDILVVDDASRDGTAAEAGRLGVRVVSHPFPLGYGAALQTGFKCALRDGYALVIQMDGDGQHDPVSLPALIRPVEEGRADVVVGSRFLEEGGYRPPLLRRMGIAFFRVIARWLVHDRLTDPTSGYKALSARAFRFCTYDLFPFDYPDTDMLITLKKAGLRVAEVPALMHPRRMGESMHRGVRPVYYLFKVCVSILATVLRQSHAYLDVLPPKEAVENKARVVP